MCGRFTLSASGEEVAEAFGLDQAPALAPRYNIAPAQPVAVVRQAQGGRRALALLPWGLAAPGTGEEGGRGQTALLINARAETAASKPTFRDAFRAGRCLVPADGFYEWERAGSRREPHHIRVRGARLFAFAGLIAPARRGPETGEACVILTTEANALVAPIHDRMPVIVRPEDYARWLDPGFHDPAGLRHVFQPFPAWMMAAARVGPAVNRVANDGPECLSPPAQKGLFEP